LFISYGELNDEDEDDEFWIINKNRFEI
jgi:hypothetical protein